MKVLQIPQNWQHQHYDCVASTMLLCNPDAVEPGHFLLITADEQTAGRGQRGNHWESDKGKNLTFNVAWHGIGVPANQQFLLSEITAIAVVKCLRDTLDKYGVSHSSNIISIKWPNDIYVGDRKICGMLLEHALSGRMIETSLAGIGININQDVFLSDAPNPISLFQITKQEVEREEVLENFVKHFMKGIELLQHGEYEKVEQTFIPLLYRRTGFYPYKDDEGEFLGEFVKLARNGILTIRRQDGRKKQYAFKEIQYLI